MTFRLIALAAVLTLTPKLPAQNAAPVAAHPSTENTRTFYLANQLKGNNTDEILVAMRNMLDPHVKVFLVESQNAIVVQAPPDQMALVEKLLTDLDRARKTYRLTYTITDIDNGKRVGTEHFSMIVIAGVKTTFKQGSKVPVITGAYHPTPTATTGAGVESQFTYLDVGINLAATLDDFPNGVRLESKVEQSSVAEERPIADVNEPVIRQTVLEGTSFLKPGKPVILGSLDIPGTTRHQDLEVVMETLQ